MSTGSVSVSVALCTYNGEAYVREQLLSILNQSVAPDEIVVSDDNSIDATLAIVESTFSEWFADHPGSLMRSTVLRNTQALGVASNFEQAIRATTGEIISLSDQDDVWHEIRLATLLAVFATRPEVLLVHSDANLVDKHGAPLGMTLFDAHDVSAWERKRLALASAMQVFVRRNLVTGATAMFRRSLLASALPIPPGWIHDEWLGIIAAAKGTVYCHQAALIDYRQHDENQIGAAKPTLRVKLNKLREPREERNRNLHIRARELVTRLSELDGIDLRTMRSAWEKQEHERYRSTIPVARLLRVTPVIATAIRGGYTRYGMGIQDILRDLAQPTD